MAIIKFVKRVQSSVKKLKKIINIVKKYNIFCIDELLSFNKAKNVLLIKKFVSDTINIIKKNYLVIEKDIKIVSFYVNKYKTFKKVSQKAKGISTILKKKMVNIFIFLKI